MWKKNNSKGIVLIACYLVIAVVLILGSGLLARSISESRIAEREKTSIQAFWLAEAGIQSGIWELNYGNSTWSGWNTTSNPYTKTILSTDSAGLTTGDITISITDPASNNPRIDATGYAPGISAAAALSTRSIRIELQRGSSPLFTSALFAQGEIDIYGSAVIDSYNSNNGSYGGWNLLQNGDVGTNGTSNDIMRLTGSVIVRGDVSTGPGGTIRKTGSIVVSGDEPHDNNINLPSVSVPSGLTSLGSSGDLDLSGSNTQTLSSGDYKFSEIELSGSSILTIEGPSKIYITGEDSIKTSGSSRIITNGQVELYVDGEIDISGAGVINQNGIPSDFFVYGTQTCEEIEYSGSSSLFAGIYAPNAEIEFSGSTVAYGSIVGNTIDITGSAQIHYDEVLATSGPSLGGGSTYTVLSWQEQ